MISTDDALRHDLQTAYGRYLVRGRRRRRIAQVAAIVSALAFVLAGAGLGAAALLGWPAPLHVQKEIAAVDRGLPADLRLNPDVEHARAVASTESATLYAASLRDGGSCTEIVTAGDRGRGAVCSTGADLVSRALELTAPFDDGAGTGSPVVLGGRLNAEGGADLEAVYADGSSEAILLGEDRYFLFEVPAEHLASVHASGLELVGRDEDGSVVARTTLPPDWDDPAVPDERAPLYVGTRSDESDFTKVFGLEGHVSAPGAVRLDLDYGDGTHVRIPIQADGSFEYAVPPDRSDDFMQPRMLVVRDEQGRVIASATVAAVAYWRGRERHTP
jgi:hypothetical protein